MSGGPGDDASTLRALGYAQELARRMGGFSNFAMSLSIICILAGGVTSFHLGLCSVGGASIGLGWPLACGFSLVVAATMAQVASVYPTAGGLYHWAAILGGRGWGWATAWFNLAGLVAVLAAIDVGAYRFAVRDALGLPIGTGPAAHEGDRGGIDRGLAGHHQRYVGIRAVTRLTDLSGYLILVVSAAIVAGLLFFASDLARLAARHLRQLQPDRPARGVSGHEDKSLALLFLLGLLLPACDLPGFDASAHAAEETLDAARNVPRGIVRSVLVSSLAGWLLLAAVVVAIPSLDEAAAQGEAAFRWSLGRVLPGSIATLLVVGIVAAQYLCGLATVTSASRVAYAFARDGGLPFSSAVRRVSPRHRTPAVAIWSVTIAAVTTSRSTRTHTHTRFTRRSRPSARSCSISPTSSRRPWASSPTAGPGR